MTTLIFENNLSSSLANVFELQALNTPVSGASSPAGIPFRLFVDTGVLTAYVQDSDPETYSGQRSELRLTSNNLDEDMWYVFEVYLDAADWVQNSEAEISIFQVHAHDAIAGTSINMSAVMSYGILKIVSPTPEPPVAPIAEGLKASYPMIFDRWVKVALHGFWKSDDQGVIEVYLDGVPVFRQFNRGTAYLLDHPYLKIGLYNTLHSVGYGYRRAYYRNLKIYRGLASYAEVLGDRPAVPARLIK